MVFYTTGCRFKSCLGRQPTSHLQLSRVWMSRGRRAGFYPAGQSSSLCGPTTITTAAAIIPPWTSQPICGTLSAMATPEHEYITASGKVLTDEEIEAPSDEAEHGYDLKHIPELTPAEKAAARILLERP